MNFLGSGKLDPVDYLFLIGKTKGLREACLAQLARKGKAHISVNRDKLAASRGKKGIFGGKPLASCIKARFKGENELSEVNFFERAVAAQGARDKWFAEKEKAMVSNYERRGLMSDGEPASRGLELVEMYAREMEDMVKALADADADERVGLLNAHAEWLYVRFTARDHLPGEFKREREEFAAAVRPVLDDPAVVGSLSDSTLYVLSLLEKDFAKKRALKPPRPTREDESRGISRR